MISPFLSIFFFLPAPLKIMLIVMGGFSWFSFRAVPHAEVAMAQAEVVPARKPAKAIEAVPVNPGKEITPLVIMVNSDGSFSIAGKKLTEAALLKQLQSVAATHPDRKILLKADALTPYQMVVNAVKISRNAGLTRVSFSSKPSAP